MVSGFVGLLLFGVIIAANYLTRNNWIEVNKNNCERNRMEELRGVVDTCYIDYNNRGTFTAFLRTKKGLIKTSNWQIEYAQAYIQNGDSVVKDSGTFRYTIYRKGSEPIIVNEGFDCDYWEKFRK